MLFNLLLRVTGLLFAASVLATGATALSRTDTPPPPDCEMGIAFETSDRGAVTQHWMRPDGSGQTEILQHRDIVGAVDSSGGAWSPDGRLLALRHYTYPGTQQQILLDLTTGEETALPVVDDRGDITAIAWSPDGTKFAYVRHCCREGNVTGRSTLRLYDTRTGEDTVLIDPASPESNMALRTVEEIIELTWSYDGERLAFTHWRNRGLFGRSHIVTLNADGTNIRTVLEGMPPYVRGDDSRSPDFGGDGVLYHLCEPEGTIYSRTVCVTDTAREITRVYADLDTMIPSSINPSRIDVSPTGQLMFSYGGVMSLYADGSATQIALVDGARSWTPRWMCRPALLESRRMETTP